MRVSFQSVVTCAHVSMIFACLCNFLHFLKNKFDTCLWPSSWDASEWCLQTSFRLELRAGSRIQGATREVRIWWESPEWKKKTLASKNSTVTPSSKCRLEIFNASKTVQSPRSACACSASHLFSVGRLSASKTIESPHSACRAQCAASKLRSSGGLAHCLENRPISEQCTGTVHGASHLVSVLRFKHHTRHHQRGCAFN